MMSTEESVRNETMHPDTVVNARLLGAQHVKISYKRIVGRCHSTLHPGKLTRRIMEEHDWASDAVILKSTKKPGIGRNLSVSRSSKELPKHRKLPASSRQRKKQSILKS